MAADFSNSPITISTDKQRLDSSYIHGFLTEAYWAKGRSLEVVQQTITHSICFGVYLGDRQIGFARVVTDTAIFAYLMDVFIDPAHRGQGYSKLLMQTILAHDQLRSIRKFFLQTSDAHGLYQQFGFQKIDDPDKLMERKLN